MSGSRNISAGEIIGNLRLRQRPRCRAQRWTVSLSERPLPVPARGPMLPLDARLNNPVERLTPQVSKPAWRKHIRRAADSEAVPAAAGAGLEARATKFASACAALGDIRAGVSRMSGH